MSLQFLATDAGQAVLSGIFLMVGDKLLKDEALFSGKSFVRGGAQGVSSFVAVGLNDAYIAPRLGAGSQVEENIVNPLVCGALFVAGDSLMHYASGSMMYKFLLSAGSQVLASYTADPISRLFS